MDLQSLKKKAWTLKAVDTGDRSLLLGNLSPETRIMAICLSERCSL